MSVPKEENKVSGATNVIDMLYLSNSKNSNSDVKNNHAWNNNDIRRAMIAIDQLSSEKCRCRK